ncbi:DUF1877 family protein [Streptomyces brasiliensis]|uniref:DUF1877 family protein n=1 Tax=Streptomyces brasiliensis TaxID=1954 RepID=A0A917KMD2_9ACTN|nr:DUF1877 family protein [Streptomyces brasiliensis]GGJ20817.1 hypothetical protein GCM10010121_034720 [Streptomyces brasiliensis]
MYFHLRAVPPPALRNSANWLRRLFEDDWETVRQRLDRHREEMLDRNYLDHDFLYTGAPPYDTVDGPGTDVVLGGRAVYHPDPTRPPFLLLTAAEADRVATYLESTDFTYLWDFARKTLLPERAEADTESQTRAAFESAHQDLTAFYSETARYGDAVVKWLVL